MKLLSLYMASFGMFSLSTDYIKLISFLCILFLEACSGGFYRMIATARSAVTTCWSGAFAAVCSARDAERLETAFSAFCMLRKVFDSQGVSIGVPSWRESLMRTNSTFWLLMLALSNWTFCSHYVKSASMSYISVSLSSNWTFLFFALALWSSSWN